MMFRDLREDEESGSDWDDLTPHPSPSHPSPPHPSTPTPPTSQDILLQPLALDSRGLRSDESASHPPSSHTSHPPSSHSTQRAQAMEDDGFTDIASAPTPHPPPPHTPTPANPAYLVPDEETSHHTPSPAHPSHHTPSPAHPSHHTYTPSPPHPSHHTYTPSPPHPSHHMSPRTQSQHHHSNTTQFNSTSSGVFPFTVVNEVSAQHLSPDRALPSATMTRLAERAERGSQRCAGEVFGTVRLLTDFLIAFLLECLHYACFHVTRKLLCGLIAVWSDSLFKPCLAATFNALLWPLCACLLQSGRGLGLCCGPTHQVAAACLEPVTELFRAIRLMEVNWKNTGTTRGRARTAINV